MYGYLLQIYMYAAPSYVASIVIYMCSQTLEGALPILELIAAGRVFLK